MHAAETLGLDDAAEEHLPDHLLAGLDIEGIELGHDVFGDDGLPARRRQYLRALSGAGPVAGHHHREIPIDGCDGLGVMQGAGGIAAVGAAAQQQNIRSQGGDLRRVVLGELVGVGPDHLGSRAKGRPLGRLAGEAGHQAAGDHAQAARGGGAGIALLIFQRARLALEFCQRLFQPQGDILLHGGIVLGGAHKLSAFGLHRRGLGIGGAEVHQQHGLHAWASRSSKSFFRASMVTSGGVPGPNTLSKPMALKRFSTSSKGCLPTTMLPPT